MTPSPIFLQVTSIKLLVPQAGLWWYLQWSGIGSLSGVDRLVCYISLRVPHVCLMPADPRGGSLGTGVVGSHNVSPGTWTQVLCKNSKCSWSLSHFSSPRASTLFILLKLLSHLLCHSLTQDTVTFLCWMKYIKGHVLFWNSVHIIVY